MNPVVRSLILGGLVAGAAVFAMGEHNETVAGLEYENAREKLRAAFGERAGYVRSLADEDRYREELSTVTKWYAAEVSGIYNRFPGKKAPGKVLKEIEAATAAGTMKEGEAQLRKEFYEEAKLFYDLFQSGRYNPVATATQNGVRFDLVSMKRDTYEGRSRLRVDFAVWGAPRRETVTKSPDGKQATAKMNLDFGLRGLGIELVDAKQKLIGGGDTGAPTIVVEHPERWIQDFPPQFAVGTWWIDPLLAEAETVLLNISGEIRSPSSGALPVTFEWKLPNRDEWKARAGEKFDGEERVMAEEDLKR